VTENQNPTLAPRWSPDGQSILYSMAVAGNTDIYRVPVTGGRSVRLTNTPGIDIGGSYSPDGSKIVFESDRSGSQQCYVMDADGSNQKRITFFGRALRDAGMEPARRPDCLHAHRGRLQCRRYDAFGAQSEGAHQRMAG
jgi:Tol biopolymer transport system component